MAGCRFSLKKVSASSQSSREAGSLRVGVGTVEDGTWIGGVGAGFVAWSACWLGLREIAGTVPGLLISRLSEAEQGEGMVLQEALFFR